MEKSYREKIFKPVKVNLEHCGTCNDQLEGDGSMGKPWKCSCGYWLWDWKEKKYHASKERERIR